MNAVNLIDWLVRFRHRLVDAGISVEDAEHYLDLSDCFELIAEFGDDAELAADAEMAGWRDADSPPGPYLH